MEHIENTNERANSNSGKRQNTEDSILNLELDEQTQKLKEKVKSTRN